MALTRTRHKMSDHIREALTGRNLMDAYHARPDYQQNDYIGWVTRAKRDETKENVWRTPAPGAGAGECWRSSKAASCI